MRGRRRIVVAYTCALAALAPASAHALDQSVHYTLSRDACRAVGGMPRDFCERVGDEAYNVDRDEWSVPAAHAQPDAGQSRCDAADAILERVQLLGAIVRDVLLTWAPTYADAELLASSLGRALHTIQDNCAHHGVSNPEHAWWSFQDSCEGTKMTPDIQPGVLECAKAETRAVWQAFRAQVVATGFAVDALEDLDSVHRGWPRRGDVCGFLSDAFAWDGVDVGWNNAIMVPALRAELIAALGSSSVPPVGDYCGGNPAALTPRTPAATVATYPSPDWCFKLTVYCIGKADAEDEAPPWSDDPGVQSDSNAGCSVHGTGGRDAAGAALVVAVGLAWRLRRPARPRR